MPRSTASGHEPQTGTLKEETLSLGSSSGSSLPDQGYAASEGMGEDSGMVSSPSDTQPTSPDGSFFLDGGRGVEGEKLLGPVRDNSSDSDEGCATWGSRHRDNAISPKAKCGPKKSNGDKPQLTAQIPRTLADLADHIDTVAKKTPYTVSTGSNMVPVSVVDMDVPITAIDEVLDDYECKIAEKEAKPITRTETAGCKGLGFGHQSSVELQNKNNNACTAADSKKSNSASTKQLPQPEHHWKSEKKTSDGDKKGDKIKAQMKETTTADANGVNKNKQRTSSTVKSSVDVQKHITEIKANPVEIKAQRREEMNPVPSSNSQRMMPAERDEAKRSMYQNNSSSNSLHGKITHVTSRFGMKTFTVTPPKPAVLNAATGVQAVTVTLGAIKIDEQGNMVTMGVSQSKAGGSSDLGTDYREVSPLLGKAKAFWSSNERKESVTHNKDLINKEKENRDGMRNTPIVISGTALKTSNIEDPKIMQTSVIRPSERGQPKEIVKEESKESVKDIKVTIEQRVEAESRVPVSKPEQSNKPTPPPSIIADLKKDVSFLKPSKRTSSQYVASAISKYTSKTSARPNVIPSIPDSSVPLKGHTFQRSGQSIQANPHQFSHLCLSDNKENVSSFKTTTPGPMRSLSYPEHVSDSLRDAEEVRPGGGGFGSRVESIKRNLNAMEKTNNKHTQSCGLTQINMGTDKDSDNVKHVWHRSPNPAQSNPLQSSAKPPATPKIVPQGQTSETRDLTDAATRQTPNEKPRPSVTEVAGVATSGSPTVTVFGPVQKFKPVICRSVEKETSLHSSLMEAIQTGGGRGRLKKTCTAAPRSMKEASYAAEENERSGLLAAIRAQGSSGQLRKTKSEAAVELQKIRKVSEEEGSAGPSSSPLSPSSTCTSPIFTPPPPPPPMIAPPPPQAGLPQVKPSTVVKASAKAPVDPALAKEAMLEAIRSGSAAERLKKVTVPTKTVKVNGRLGTIQATSSTLPQE